ncbi:MAG: hypothetical protein ACYDAB_14495 [bacterium]
MAVARLNDWVWVYLPSRVSRWSAALLAVFADGAYLSAWPLVGALILPAALCIGWRLGWSQPGNLYMTSFVVLGILVFLSQHSAAIGLSIWIGYVLGGLFQTLSVLHWSVARATVLFAPLALADVLLGLLLVIIPLTARLLSLASAGGLLAFLKALPVWAQASGAGTVKPGSSRAAIARDERLLLVLALQAVTEFLFVSWWVLGIALFLQPYVVWQGITPSTHGWVALLRQWTWPLGILAAYVGAVRSGLEFVAETKPAYQTRAFMLRVLLLRSVLRYNLTFALATAPLKALVLTFITSVLLASWQQGILVFVIITLVLLARDIGFGRFDLSPRFLTHIPVIVRFFAAVLINYVFIVRTGGGVTYSSGLVAIVLSLIVFLVLLPGPRPLRRGVTR